MNSIFSTYLYNLINISHKFSNFSRHLLALYSCRRRHYCKNKEPIISFSFDDYPKSSLSNGGSILQKYGYKATFYVSLGRIGSYHQKIGSLFDLNTLKSTISYGHELGCHTFNHLDAWNCTLTNFIDSINTNQIKLKEYFNNLSFKTFSYPKGQATPKTKRAIEKHFLCCRGTYPGINFGLVDLNMLKANSIYQNNVSYKKIKNLLNANAKSCGSLIFYTHDVRNQCSPFGCTEDTFKMVVDTVSQSGMKVLPIKEAMVKI